MATSTNFQNAVSKWILKPFQKKRHANISRYKAAKESIQARRSKWRTIRGGIFVTLGIISAGFGLEGFLIPGGLIDGGVTGISLLINQQTGLPFPILLLCINLPFILLGWRQIGKNFSIKSIVCIALLALVVTYIHYPIITKDKVLIAVFGGFFLGAGVGLTIRGGAVIDGTEILAITLSRKRSVSVGDIIMLFNILIFSVAAWLNDVEMALYSILTYMAAAKTVDFILEGIEEFTGVTIISPHSEEIATFIKDKMGRGLTIYVSKKGFGKRGENAGGGDIIYTVVTRLEISRLANEVEKIDPNAFIVMQSVNDTRGGMVKKRPLNH